MKIRTRYAPSPTGFFHVGGARTAIFNYLFAKHNNGDFICRIEDTDIERNVAGGIDSQLNNLDWLCITPDESPRLPGHFPPYIQTEKLQRYQALAHQLIKEGRAYYCFCTKEELIREREVALTKGMTPKYNRKCWNLSKEQIEKKISEKIPAAVRLKMPDDTIITWNDLVRGKMEVPTSALTDPVILKSNGIPMYNFAVVVDDYDMKISHVLRGEEHLSNTPYQIAIKESLGFNSQNIQYGHLSVIVDETGKKLSKRNADLKQFIDDYKKMGFIPQAIVNFLSLLGWSPADGREYISMEELIKCFDITRLSKAPAFFDFKKMLWIGNQYFKSMPDSQYLNFVLPFINIDKNFFLNYQHFNLALLIFKPQISYATQISDLIQNTFMSFDINNISSGVKKMITTPHFLQCINSLEQIIQKYDSINLINANEIVGLVKTATNLNGIALYFPIRFAAIGKEHGPEMNKILTIIGKQNILKNITQIKRFLNTVGTIGS